MLECGADDVLKKTADMGMLFTKMKALIRRYTELNHAPITRNDIINYRKLVVDMGHRAVYMDEKEILSL